MHHHSINTVGKLVEEGCIAQGITGYREDLDAGLLRYLLFAVETSTGKVQVTFVVNSYSTDAIAIRLISGVCEWFTSSKKKRRHIHSFWIHFNPASRHNNSITGRLDNSWSVLHGESMLRERLMPSLDPSGSDQSNMQGLNPRLCYPPNVFRQANILGFSRIVSSIRKWIPQKSRVMELYAGVGTIGLQLLDLVKCIQCSDENPYNVTAFAATIEDIVETTGKEKYRKRAVYMSSPAR